MPKADQLTSQSSEHDTGGLPKGPNLGYHSRARPAQGTVNGEMLAALKTHAITHMDLERCKWHSSLSSESSHRQSGGGAECRNFKNIGFVMLLESYLWRCRLRQFTDYMDLRTTWTLWSLHCWQT